MRVSGDGPLMEAAGAVGESAMDRNHLANLIHQHHEGEFYFDARQAKRLGFVNRLGMPKIRLTTHWEVLV